MKNITKLSCAIATKIHADQLTEGDTIIYQGSCILVVTEPRYTALGIVFNALWLYINSPDNIQELWCQPEELFELVSYTPISNTPLTA